MKKKLTRLFSVLLAAVLVFGTLPISAMGTDVADPPAGAADESAVESLVDESSAVDDAAQPEEQSAEDEGIAVQATDPVDGYDMNVFLLDCGRKYYSVNNIKTFIDEASDAGFNYIQLVVGNEGLRFLLNDMSVQDYSSDDVKVAIQQGNLNYNKSQEKYTPDTNELTQDEMDTIIDYAYSKGMGVIPCVNSPGHMTAILSAANTLTGKDCAYSNSTSRIEVTNSAATEFTQALLQKYIDYFAGKGCKYFNMGADEYDFNGIKYNTTKYKAFISYINSVAKQIEDAGMTPMAFNDGIYYAGNTNCGTIDPKIVVFYWTYGYDRNGRGGYVPTSTSNLSDFKLINTNESYYWALNDNNEQYKCTGDLASKFDYKKFVDGTTPTNVKGSMFCVWSDQPGYGGEDYVIEQTKDAIAKFGTTLPTVEKVSKPTDSGSTGITITPAENNDGTLTVGSTLVLNAGKTATWTAEPADIVELTSADETAAYSNGLSAQKVKVTAKQTGDVTITASDGDQTASYPLTVQASDVDLGKVASLEIQYWITNYVVYKSDQNSASSVKISAAEANSEDGIAVANQVPTKGHSFFDGDVSVYYWQTMRLSKDNKQTTTNGNDGTLNGETLTHVRYQNKWQYKTLAGEWQDFQAGDQVVAYYLQKTSVTKEIDTYMKDWGFDTNTTAPTWSDNYSKVALTVAAVYPDGTVSPAEGQMYSQSTVLYNYDENRNIGIIAPENNSDYQISKITVTDGKRVKNTGNKWGTNESIDWNKTTNAAGKQWYDETTVWDKTTNAGTTPVVNGAATNPQITWSAKNTAKLVLIYLEPIKKETNLNLVYYNRTTSETILETQISMTYNQGDQVPTYDTALKDASGKTIGNQHDWNGKTSSDANYLPDDAYVVNSTPKEQTFNKEVSTVPGVSDKYQSGLYKYDGAEISEDGMTLTLYYVADASKLSANYVIDFGTPVEIPLSDFVENWKSLANVTWNGSALQAGNLKYDSDSKTLTYTPTKVLNETYTLTFTLTYNSGEKDLITIGMMPASNVLYEENFLTKADGWTESTVSHTDAQETQKAKEAKSVFGYDDTYKSVTGENGAWKAEHLDTNGRTNALTTEFYGNTFDLIGNCAEDTGRVLMMITSAKGHTKLIDIDTRYNDGSIYQVPLAHVELGEDGIYTVKVYAAQLKATSSATTPNAVATMSLDDADVENDEVLAQILEENDLTLDEVEYTSISAMDTVSAMDVPNDGVATYAADNAIVLKAGTHVEINGFRVYRTTDENDAVAQNYPANEQNVTYTNILDAVKGEITAYTEADGALYIDVQDYEASGGPQNEIYLASGQSVYFKAEALKGKQVQVSLRAVNTNATAAVEGTTISLTSNTEMYYTLIANADGEVMIANNGTGLLAIGNVKLPNGISTENIESASEAGDAAVLAALKAVLNTNDEPAEVFTPETFTAKTTSTKVIRNKVVTLKVNVSSDVAYVTVNGVKYTRTGLQSMFQKTRTIRVVNTVPKNQTKTYEVIAYNDDGVASEAITVTG